MSVPRLYAITHATASRSHVDQVRELAAAGVGWIQIRDKRADARSLYEVVVAALDAVRGTTSKIVVNDRVDVARAAGAHGAHVGQEDLPAEAARAILGRDAILGVSTHSVAQAAAANALPVDYIAIGPVFSTSTKANPDPVVGLDGVAAVRAIVSRPLVAIGGITLERASSVLAAGADSVAVVGDLHVGASIEDRARELLSALDVDGIVGRP